jgi:hypothetical protein
LHRIRKLFYFAAQFKNQKKTKNMKKLLLAVGVLASSMTFAQSNAPGVIQLGLGYGATLGGATIKSDAEGAEAQDGVGVNGNYNLRAQYGLSEKFSAGIFIRRESAAYVVTPTVTAGGEVSDFTLTTTGFAFGVEPKFYAVNKDKFALYFALPIGFSTATLEYSFSGLSGGTLPTGSASGLNYGLTMGFNWWWADFIGMSLDLGYGGSSISGKFDGDEDNLTIGNNGFYFGLGLVSKFGGK